jgi:hypothetical protein
MSTISVVQVLDEAPTLTPTGGTTQVATATVSKAFAWTGSNPEGGTTAYSINWGDGGSVSTGNFTGTTTLSLSVNHTYATAGAKTIVLTATDAQGSVKTSTVTVTVS